MGARDKHFDHSTYAMYLKEEKKTASLFRPIKLTRIDNIKKKMKYSQSNAILSLCKYLYCQPVFQIQDKIHIICKLATAVTI